MVDRYGDEVEADLHREYGLDLLDFFRGLYSWRKLRNLIEKLPSRSLTTEAIINDDDVAQQVLASKKPDAPDTGPRVSEYTPEVQRLDDLKDLIVNMTATIVAVAGGKPRPGRPSRRPETAFTRALKAQSMAKHHSLLAEVEQAQARWLENNP